MSTRNRIGIWVAVLVLLASTGACVTESGESGFKALEVTAENQAQLWDQVQNGTELSGREIELLKAYVERNPPAEGAYLPVGMTLAAMIENQRGFEAAAGDGAPGTTPEKEPGQDPVQTAAGTTPSDSDKKASSTGPAVKTGSPPPASPPKPAPPATTTLPSGTVLKVRLDQPLSTKTNEAGERFSTLLDEDLMVDGKLVAPSGSLVRGRLMDVQRSGRVKGRARMSITLDEIVIDDDRYDIETNRLSFEAEGSRKSDAKKVGIGAAAGAVIGAIAGGGKGAAVGGAIGAGAGGGAVVMTRGNEVEFRIEQLFEFKTRDDVKMKIIRK